MVDRAMPHRLGPESHWPGSGTRSRRRRARRRSDPVAGLVVVCSSGGCWLRITFHGATRQVTGSAHLLEIGPYRLLLDCGLFDSERIDPSSPNRQLSFDPRALDAVIVSHAHNDHIGRLPCLVRGGVQRADLRHTRHGRHHQRHAPRQCPDPARGCAQCSPPPSPHRDARAAVRPAGRRMGRRAAQPGPLRRAHARSCRV